jgi:hypothetical protein
LKEYLISINGNCSAELPSQLEVMHNHVVREKSIYTVINQLSNKDYVQSSIDEKSMEDKN